jgi:lipoprotein NlpI
LPGLVAVADDNTKLRDQVAAAMKENDVAKALKLTDDAIQANPKKAEPYLIRASIYMADKKFDKAIADFTKTLELEPSGHAARNQRGIANFKAAKIAESLADFDAYIEKVPQAAAAHWQRGLTLYYADKFADGVKQFTTSDKAEPEDVENAIWHFLCNARVQGIDKARGEFFKVKADPRGAYMMTIYKMFKGEAKPDEVFKVAESGEGSKDPEQIRRFYAHYYVGMFYEATGEAKKSYDELKTAHDKYPISHYMMDVAAVHLKLRKK